MSRRYVDEDMSQEDSTRTFGGLVRPGRALSAVMVGLAAIWLMFAIAINWGGATEALFLLFCGNTERIVANGEVWRLFTAAFMHAPSGTIGHIVFALLGLFFLAPTLEHAWGGARMLRFLLLSAIIAYGFQMAVELLAPAPIAAKLVGTYWFGAFPVIEAVAVAWALSFKGQTVRLWPIPIPMTSRGLIIMVVGLSMFRLIALSQTPEGLLSPFGGMFAGWLLGASTPSPLRRAYLRLRLAQLDREAARGKRRRRGGQAPFRVIEGGRSRAAADDDDPRGPDGRFLN